MTKAFKLPGKIEPELLHAVRIIERIVGNAWATNANGDFLCVKGALLSRLASALEGFDPEAKSGPLGWKQIIHPDDYDRFIAEWCQCVEHGRHFEGEYRMLRASGAYGWSRSSAEPIQDNRGRTLGWYGAVIDCDTTAATLYSGDSVVSTEEVGRNEPSNALRSIHPDDLSAATHAAARAFWTGVPQVTRHRQLQGDGSYRWAETRSEPGYSVSVPIDDLVIDNKPHARSADDLLRSYGAELVLGLKAVESIFGNGWAFDASGRWIYLHSFAQSSLGVTPEMLNTSVDEGYCAWKRLLHPDDYERVAATWQLCLNSGDDFNVEFRFRRASGAYVWARTAARAARDSNHQITGWFGIALDIDVYKKTVEALRGRERELSQLIDMVPVQIRRLTPDGQPTFFNKRLLDFFGMSDIRQLDEAGVSRLEAAMQKLIHPADAGHLLDTVRHAMVTGSPYFMKYRIRRADGDFRWVDGRGEPLIGEDGDIAHWYVISIDIDDEMRTQEALRERERELSQLVDMVPSLLWRLDQHGVPTFFNKRLVSFLGLDEPGAGELDTARLTESLNAAVHPEDASSLAAALRYSVASGERFSKRFRLRRADGAYRWVEGTAEPLRDDDGQILQWYGLTHDIDDQLRVEEALRERERSLRQLVETLPAMIDCAAPDGEPVYRSEQLREFLGYNPEELGGAGKSRLDATLEAGVHPDDLVDVRERYANSLKTGEPFARKHRLRRADGEYRWVETRATAMRNSDGQIVQWNMICLDIDGEVRMQEELRLSQEKLARATQAASLAELSASIAHEVNQPLAAIVANSNACHRWLSVVPPNLERAKITAERIIRDANSAAEVVSRIRALFKQPVEVRTDTDFSALIAEARNLIAEEALRRRVRIDVHIDRELPNVEVDPIHIQQVLVNLIRNGMDAMETVAGERVVAVRASRVSDTVRTEISDRGTGVKYPDRIFESFFTTKTNGMGMGLAICRSIIDAHGGRLWAQNNEPTGATFVFTLPLKTESAG
ncbi:PAS domain-containing protein [Ensifer sp. ENS07]|uniref:PAS domain-containing protein n=1 Tax=unclassified Ensifer TaxID=2633371 RepID=UPI00177DE067|nr:MULTISPECIES: PAS domain-containing protein [unclassified Ensifer]MBD9508120.1 PAS domain-containing protein [Ensifer sp. ENS10]MBD9637384.1 PAS domain-containing protein [Ensifer sp. ENS07]